MSTIIRVLAWLWITFWLVSICVAVQAAPTKAKKKAPPTIVDDGEADPPASACEGCCDRTTYDDPDLGVFVDTDDEGRIWIGIEDSHNHIMFYIAFGDSQKNARVEAMIKLQRLMRELGRGTR